MQLNSQIKCDEATCGILTDIDNVDLNVYSNGKNNKRLLIDNNNTITFSVYNISDIIETYPHPWKYIKNGINGILTSNIIIISLFILFIIFIHL